MASRDQQLAALGQLPETGAIPYEEWLSNIYANTPQSVRAVQDLRRTKEVRFFIERDENGNPVHRVERAQPEQGGGNGA